MEESNNEYIDRMMQIKPSVSLNQILRYLNVYLELSVESNIERIFQNRRLIPGKCLYRRVKKYLISSITYKEIIPLFNLNIVTRNNIV